MIKSKKPLALLMATILMLTLVPTAALAVGIQPGTPAIEVNTATPTTVAFGGKQWVVIGHDGSALGTGGTTTPANAVTLLLASGQSYGTSKFHDMGFPNYYSISLLRNVIDAAYANLSAKEQGLVVSQTLTGESGNYGDPTYNDNNIAGPLVADAKFWPLSVNEANALDASLRIFAVWWLRTPGSDNGAAAYVGDNGTVSGSGLYINFAGGNVRPAFHLNLSSVLFTSAASAASGKSSVTAWSGLSAAVPPAGAVKFTMQDASLTLASVTSTAVNGRTITFDYTGATAGKTLSAVVLNQGGGLRYYGKLAENIAQTGTANVSVPNDFDPTTDTLQIFVEECNGDNETDFASVMVLLPVTLQPVVPGGNDSLAIPQTGDMSHPLFFALLGLASLAGLGAMRLHRKKRRT